MNIRDNHRFAKANRTYSLVGASASRATMSEPTPKDPRGPTNLRIKFRSASLDQFIERYAVDVSRGGIFIRTREPLAVGTRLKLEFQLQDSAPLLAGEGTVVWIREHDQTRDNVTPGMGVRFDKLTPESQPTLEKILAEKTRLEQAGVAAVGQAKGGGGGMAVRRPSGVFASLDANARAVLGANLPGASESAATGPESTPIASPRAPRRRPLRRSRRSRRPASWDRARAYPRRPLLRRSRAPSPGRAPPPRGRSRSRRRCSSRRPRPTSTKLSRRWKRRPAPRRRRDRPPPPHATSPMTPRTSRRAWRT